MNSIYQKLTLSILLSCITLFSCKGSEVEETPPTPPAKEEIKMPEKEFRAVWMATVGRMDWPASSDVAAQKEQYIRYLDLFEKYNINAVVFQVRPTADAFYPSTLEPWSEYIGGSRGLDPGYDVLRFLIDETHKRGMEFHAWMNPFRISNNATQFKPVPGYAADAHPEWTMRYGNLLMFRPALPEVRQHLLNVIRELVTRYDVDGLHFDDYFYPYPAAGREIDDAGDFLRYGTGYKTVEDFRRGNVDKMIEAIHKLVVNECPGVLFGISPYAAWRHRSQDPNGSDTSGINNYDDLYADIRLWCEKGWIDYVTPQLYSSTKNIALNFVKLSEWWPANSFDVPVIVGYGLYRFGNPKEGDIYMNPVELETQFYYARKQPKIVGGFLFNGTSFTANKIDIMSTVAKMYPGKALLPFMGRSTVAAPAVVSGVKVSNGQLTWDAQSGCTRYAVYRIAEQTATLAGIVTTNTYKLEEKGTYAVSGVNADNTEGELSSVITY